jgi:ribosomal protein S18 acetylase RimI-like enzyme
VTAFDPHHLTLRAFQAAARAIPGVGACESLDGWLLYDSGTGLAGLNQAFVASRAAPSLATPDAWFSARNAPYSLMLRSGFDDGVAEAARVAGFREQRRQPVMVMTGALPKPAFPADAVLHLVRDEEDARQFLAVRPAPQPDLPPDDVEAAGILDFVGTGAFRYFVVTLDERPIARASAFVDGEEASLSNVMVHPDYRRQGLGTSVTLAAAQDSGARAFALTASAMGRPVYERLGFERVYDEVRLQRR